MPELFCNQYPILLSEPLAPGFFSMIVQAKEAAALAVAGQFAHILCGEKILRRPISICEIDKTAGTLRFVFEVRGQGTSWLSRQKAGDCLDLIAPLGNGFQLPVNTKKILLIGGGIGVPPLLGLARQSLQADAVLGFRTADAAILADDFARVCSCVRIATIDGSLGSKGLVVEPAEQLLQAGAYDLICACGPTPMLKAVSDLAQQYGVPCLVSLEERMACGVGACLGCALKLKSASGEEYYGHVCKNGPVFQSSEVVWE